MQLVISSISNDSICYSSIITIKHETHMHYRTPARVCGIVTSLFLCTHSKSSITCQRRLCAWNQQEQLMYKVPAYTHSQFRWLWLTALPTNRFPCLISAHSRHFQPIGKQIWWSHNLLIQVISHIPLSWIHSTPQFSIREREIERERERISCPSW